MWECYVCSFQNVDAAPVCAKCRARKPAPGEEPRGRDYTAMTEAARSREAERMMEFQLPGAPALSELKDKWREITLNPAGIHNELAKLELRQYATRDALQLIVSVLRNPNQRGVDDLLKNAILLLKTWDED
jgi:hypothetical protein